MLRLTLTTLTLTAALAAPAAALDPGSTIVLDRPLSGGAFLDGIDDSELRPGRSTSADGRYVVFTSESDDLSPLDDDTVQNVYRRDRLLGLTQVVTVGLGAWASDPAISGDGSVVAFTTKAALDGADDNGAHDIYVSDLDAGTLELASRATGAAGDVKPGASREAALDHDGSTVAFASQAVLASTDESQSRFDVYRRDLATDTTTHVSRASGANGTSTGSEASGRPDLSGDGAVVAFETTAAYEGEDDNDSTDVYVREGTTTELVSRAGDATSAPGDAQATAPSISADGNRIAFQSGNAYSASDLNGTALDVYVRDRDAATLTLVSRRNGVGQVAGNAGAFGPAIAPNGQHVAFLSSATNLTTGDDDAFPDAYVRALSAGTTTLMSRASGPAGENAEQGVEAVDLSDGAGVVAFHGESRRLSELAEGDVDNVFVRAGTATELVSRPDGPATEPFRGGAGTAEVRSEALSDDGRWAVFTSEADNLSAADDDRFDNVFLRDVATGEVRLLSRTPDGQAADGSSWDATISGDGTHVAFQTRAANLTGDPGGGDRLVVVDVATGAVEVASRRSDGTVSDQAGEAPVLDADGSRVAFVSGDQLHPDDPDSDSTVYVRDLRAGTTAVVARGDDGLVDDEATFAPSISADGQRVAFVAASPLAPGVEDDGYERVYVRDFGTGRTLVASVADGAAGAPSAEGYSNEPSISADGQRVAFSSDAPDLGDGDADDEWDVHLRDLAAGRTVLVSVSDAGAKATEGAGVPQLSADGRVVAFISDDPALTGGSDEDQVIVRDLAAGRTRVASRGHGADGPLLTEGLFGAHAVSGNGACVTFGTLPGAGLPGGFDAATHRHAYLRAVAPGCPAGTETPGGGHGPGQGGGAPAAVSGALPAPGNAAVKDRLAPAVTGVKVVRGRRGVRLVRFTLSEAGRATVTLSRKLAGRRRGRACVKPALVKRRGAKRCSRLVVAKTLVVTGKAGANEVALPKRLAAGSYVVDVRARDAAGNGSNPRTVALRVVS